MSSILCCTWLLLAYLLTVGVAGRGFCVQAKLSSDAPNCRVNCRVGLLTRQFLPCLTGADALGAELLDLGEMENRKEGNPIFP